MDDKKPSQEYALEFVKQLDGKTFGYIKSVAEYMIKIAELDCKLIVVPKSDAELK